MGHPGFLKTYEETKAWLDRYKISSYNIDSDTLEVDVDGNVPLEKCDFKYIPVKFRYIQGYFGITGCVNLLSLKGCPEEVEENGCFFADYCMDLITLEHLPQPGRLYLFDCKGCVSLISNKISDEYIPIVECSEIVGNVLDKYKRYKKWLLKHSIPEQYSSLQWLRENDPELFEELLPYLYEYIISMDIDLNLSEDHQHIINISLNVNHKL